MESTCEQFMDTNLLSLKKLTAFLKRRRVCNCEYIDEKKPICKLTVSRRVLMPDLDCVTPDLADVLSSLHGQTSLLGQQTAQLVVLILSVRGLCSVAEPDD